MPKSNEEILEYENNITKIITNTFMNNEQTIILYLFRQMTTNNDFPLQEIDVNAFSTYFWEHFLSDNPKIPDINSYNIENNCIQFETDNYFAHLWIKTIKKNVAFFDENLIQVEESTSTYSISNSSIDFQPAIDEYRNDKPNLTFILEFAEDTDNFFSSIRLACIPHNQLREHYNDMSIISKRDIESFNFIYFNFNNFSNELWRYQILYSRLNKFSSLCEIQEVKNIEEIEKKYLNKYYHFMKYIEDEMLLGFKTKEKIRNDWFGFYNPNLSDFARGAERIIYSLFNGKGIGQPNSSPVGSDMFFEVEDAYIHIDLKTVQLDNISDYNTNIFVGLNQNSYKGNMVVNATKFNEEKSIRKYQPSLPCYYCNGTPEKKLCLSYFVTILYDKTNLDIYIISLLCMPNGLLEKVYGSIPLQAGKNINKTRYRFSKIDDFITFEGEKRIKCIIRDNEKINSYTYENNPRKRLSTNLSYYLSLDM